MVVDNAVIITTAISAVAALSGIYLGWAAKGRELAKEHRNAGSTQAKLQGDIVMVKEQVKDLSTGIITTNKLQVDMEYIKRGVDDLRIEARDQGRRFDELSERITRIEESAKQAHKRIDRLEGVLQGGGPHD